MMKVHYSQCWEDPRVLRDGLEVTPEDDVISIASGGDNTFALLLDHPKSITAVDKNQAQIFLVELKMQAIQNLTYDDFVSFVGARPCQNRQRLYSRIRSSLSEQARRYWDAHTESIRRGIIHCGKFENYFAIFRQIVLPLIHTRKGVKELLEASSLDQQRIAYDEMWDNRRWRWMFLVFFGKFLLGRVGRDPSLFRYVTVNNVGEELLRRSCHGLTEVSIHDNFFVEYILTGQYTNLEIAHPYLRESHFQFFKENIGKIQLVCGSLRDYLKNLSAGTVSKFNLSDIFEYMSDDDFHMTLQEIQHVSRADLRLAYWTLFVPRAVPSSLADRMILHLSSERRLATGRTFFYESFYVWDVTREISDQEVR
jgi:S-adenosylmethionine-diacylglycerol 3-amino-3-carboxypropyl transferase